MIDLLDIHRERVRRSLYTFVEMAWPVLEPNVDLIKNWSMQAICEHLEAVTRGDIKRLLINVPPGFSKSLLTNVFWPAWEWGAKGLSHYRYLSFSHEKSLPVRDLLRCRALILSDWYQQMFPGVVVFRRDQNAKTNYEDTATGWRRACALLSMTGHRGDRVLGDDPHSVNGAESEADRNSSLRAFAETVPTRLNSSESAIVVIMQRIHELDISGFILSNDLGYIHLMLPMEYDPSRACYTPVKPGYIPDPKVKLIDSVRVYQIDPREVEGELLDGVRFPRVSVNELKKTFRAWGGMYAEAGQLQQLPAPREGGLFKREDFRIVDGVAELPHITVRGWDLAASETTNSAWTVGVEMSIFPDSSIIIHHVLRFRKSPGLVETAIKGIVVSDGKRVIQSFPTDPGQAGKSQVHNLGRLLRGYSLHFTPESGSKETRIIPFAAQVENGNVSLVRGEWNAAYLDELSVFPASTYADQVDATSRAYNYIIGINKRLLASKPSMIT